jgi:RimJ/RimL family protein N-acetyltransferase
MTLHECSVTHPALADLFDLDVPNNPVLWAVLRGRNGGRAWVDDLQTPSQCVLRTDSTLAFASRQISQAFLHQAIMHLRQIGPVWFVQPLPLAPQASSVFRRLEFYDCDPRSRALADLQRLPDGLDIRPIDRRLLERCQWREEMEFFCGSVDNFLENGIGLALMQGDEIISEAYATSLGEARAEIGAVTREEQRGRGYAPIACTYLIQACARRGYQAYWSCDADNAASARVARKLGFEQERAYQVLEYSALS